MEKIKLSARSVSILQAFFVVFLWATSWVLIKFGLHEIPPLIFAGLRYFLAFFILLVLLLFGPAKREIAELPKPMWVRLILLGLLFYGGTQGASFVALAYLPAVTVNLLWNFSSVMVAFLGIIWLSEQPTQFQWGGIVIAIIGACIYFYPVTIPHAQFLCVFVAAFGVMANALSAIMGRGINRSAKQSPLVVTVVSMGAGSTALLAAGLVVEGLPVLNIESWAIIAWLAGVNTAFAFTLWNHTLRTLTAAESSIINGSMLIWIPIFAVLFLGESVTVKEIIGLAAAGAGTLLVQLRVFPKGKKPAA